MHGGFRRVFTMDEQVKEKETAKESSVLFWVKLQACLTGGVLALLLIVGIFGVVQVNNVMRVFRGVDMEKVNSTVLALQSAAEDLDMEALNKTVDSLKAAAENLGSADIDAVNDGIKALTAAADNLQGLDIEKMNELIESLKTVSDEMEKTTSAFSKLFGR